jgi:t-SNARE complex subunit (syntaxin)
MQEDVDTTHMRLRAARKKISEVLRRSRQDKQLCLIISLSIVLVILTVLAIA